MNEHGQELAPWLADTSMDTLRRIIDALYRVHHLISAIADLDTLLLRIMEEGNQVAHAEACSLLLYDAKNSELYFHVALGESGNQQALKDVIRLKMGQGIAGRAASERRTINVADVRKDDRFYQKADETAEFETRSLLAVPLVDRDTLIGVVEVINKVGGGQFSNVDARVLEMFSAVAAAAIVNARLIEENLQAERMAAIGQAMTGLSHYTKNLVNGLAASVELIQEGLDTGNTDYLVRSWPVFRRSTQRIADCVEDMLAFSKDRKPLRTPCAIEDIFTDVVESFQGLLVRKDVKLHTDTGGGSRPLLLDGTGIHRCLLNLMVNAADAVPPQGGSIKLAASFPGDGSVELTVSDNGPGVAPDHIAHIFDPFYSTKGSQGTGIGLAVTHKIVEEHGGTISVAESPEGGALFRIVLPKTFEQNNHDEKETE